jgi:acyl-coenzyme A synthetase/AMP-(fatty) acid ligase
MTNPERSLAEQPSVPPMSARLQRVLALEPSATALKFNGNSYPWAYFAATVRDLDDLLLAYPQARRIGIVMRNRPGPVAAAIATIATGRQIVTLSPHAGDAGLAEDIAALRPDVIVADDQDWERDGVQAQAALAGAIAARTSSERGLEARAADWTAAPSCLPTDGVSILMMTSGTTGKPKRVALSYEQLAAAFTAAGTDTEGEAVRLRSGAAILWASLAHISGLYFAIAHALEGRAIALMERFEVEPWARLVRELRPGYLRLPPAAIRMVLQADLPIDTFASVRAVGSGTAPLSPELSEAFYAKYGVPVLVKYGATEFAGAIAGWSLRDYREYWQDKRGSVGRVHPGIELRVTDPDSTDPTSTAPLPPDAVGILEVSGRQLGTEEGQWVRTNDLASLDVDGFLYIHGRADDAINRGGFKIPPSVIEDALREHPAVSDAAAVGLPDERLGEVPAAAVTLRGPATERELLDYLAARLTRYQLPVLIRVLAELPRSPSMKVNRPRLREIVLDSIEPEGAATEVPSHG